MRTTIVVAISRNGVIGIDGGLPWRLSADLQHFKAVTMDNPIVMGRKTHESIGRPLPGRLNIVVTHQTNYATPGCEVANSLGAALAIAGDVDEVMIVGGASLYAEALAQADRIYLTEVHVDVEGDIGFPVIDPSVWQETSREFYVADERNQYDYSFVILDRIGAPQSSGKRSAQ